MDDCQLRAAHGIHHVACDEERCIYWRVLEHLDSGKGEGCAIKHHHLLENDEVSAWLLSVKERVERAASGN